MLEDGQERLEDVRKEWDELSKSYDKYFNTLEGKVDHHLRWGLIEGFLPENRDARILDAGGGTGIVTLPLAQMGYRVTLCDLSLGQLRVAEKKLRKEGLFERIELAEADIASLPFPDEFFNLVLCVRGPLSLATDSLKAVGELARVMKRGGKICVDASSRYWTAIHESSKDPAIALKLVKFELSHACGAHGFGRVFSPKELGELFEGNSIRVIGIYGDFVCSLPAEMRKATTWTKKSFSRVTEMIERLSKEPSITGMGSDLILLGEKV